MQEQDIRNKQSKGIQWNTITSVLVFLIQITVSYFLNKMITDEEFGKALWAFAVVGFSLFFSHFSWFDILIREKDVNESKYSTAFFISLFTNGLLFCIFFFGADTIASFSKEFDSSNYLKAYSFLFVFTALAMIPTAKLTKEIEFKVLSQFNIIAKITSSFLAITLAIKGMPFLSLFFLYIGTDIINSILVILKVKWLPNFNLNLNYVKNNIGFASSLTVQKFSGVIGSNLDNILIGRDYSKSEVGSYSKSYGIRSMPISFIARSITKVTFPTLANFKESKAEFQKTYFDTQHLMAFLLLPLFGLLIFLAKPFAIAYFDEDWNISLITQLLIIFSISGVFAAFNPLFNSALSIQANAKTINKITFLQRSIFVIVLLIAFKFGLIYIALAKLISSVIDFIIYGIYTNQYFKTNYFNSLKQLIPTVLNMLIAGFVAAFVYQFIQDWESHLLAFIVPAMVYGIIYLLLALFIDKKGWEQMRINILNR